MDRHHCREVSYGNLGPGSYDTQDQTWQFPRRSADDAQFQIVEQYRVSPAILEHEHKDAKLHGQSESLPPARLRVRRINALLNTFPELVPCASILPQLEQTSEVVNNVASVHDPQASDYLAYGSVNYDHSLIPQHLRFKRILASVTGTSRHIVRLSLVQQAKYTIDQVSPGPSFIIDRYHGENSVFWRGQDQSRIQQILFSSDALGGSFLGIRRSVRIEILRPRVRTVSISTNKLMISEIGTGEYSKASNLDPSWLLDISSDQFNGLPILQFAFHPSKSTQLVLLDAHGEIRLFGIEQPQTARGPWSASQLTHISLLQGTHGNIIGDPWANIVWSPNGNSIVFTQRNAMFVHNLTAPDSSPTRLLESLWGHETHVLDLRCEGHKTGLLFVLTTTSITILTPGTGNVDIKGHSEPFARTPISIAHHRDPMDKSLRLSVGRCDHHIFVLIYSHLVPLITGYKIELDRNSNVFKHITDPFSLLLSRSGASTSRDRRGERGYLCLKMRCASVETADNGGLLNRTMLHIVTLNSDLETFHTIAITQNTRSSPQSLALAQLSQQQTLLGTEEDYSYESDFIVEDRDSFEDERNLLVIDKSQTVRYDRTQSTLRKVSRFLADNLNRSPSTTKTGSRRLGSQEIVLQSILEDQEQMTLGVHTLAELLPHLLSTDKVETASCKAAEVMGTLQKLPENSQAMTDDCSLNDLRRKIVSHILLDDTAFGDVPDYDSTRIMTFDSIYEDLLRLHLETLPSETPSSVELWLKGIIQQAAMHLFLASRGLQALPVSDMVSIDETQSATTRETGSQQTFLPLRARGAESTILDSNSQIGTADNVRNTWQSIGPESEPGYTSSSQQTVRDEVQSGRLVGATLAGYIQLRGDSQLHRTLRRAVPEWHVGTTPTGQEWRSMTRSASQESLASAQSGKRRKKDKGKGPATKTASSVCIRNSDSLGLSHTLEQETRHNTAFDVDSYPRHWQTSLPTPGRTPVAAYELPQAPALSSQSLLVHNSQVASQNSLSQNTSNWPSKKPQSKKRPLGFR